MVWPQNIELPDVLTAESIHAVLSKYKCDSLIVRDRVVVHTSNGLKDITDYTRQELTNFLCQSY